MSNTYRKVGFIARPPKKGKKKNINYSRHQCPLCDEKTTTEDIIKLRADFWECRKCGFTGDDSGWLARRY